MQWVDLQRQGINSNGVLQAGGDQPCDGMDIEQHARLEAQLDDVTPLPKRKLDALFPDNHPRGLCNRSHWLPAEG